MAACNSTGCKENKGKEQNGGGGMKACSGGLYVKGLSFKPYTLSS